MPDVHDILIRKLEQHSAISDSEKSSLRALPLTVHQLRQGEDLVRQGDRPDVSVIVLSGMLARYHTLRGGGRQYLSFHIAGDWPDAQTLFLERIDHSVGAIAATGVAMIPHRNLIALFKEVPSLGFILWRETLIDAAIFREAITNNGKRPIVMRLAHFLCEQFYRAKVAELTEKDSCDFPLSQTQLADALASSLTTINRAMQQLRKSKTVDVKAGRLFVYDWKGLADHGDFDPGYLHLRERERT